MHYIYEKLSHPDRSFRCFRREEDVFSYHVHHHEHIELTLIEQGTGRRFVGDHVEDYGPGDLVLIGPEIPHGWTSDNTKGRQTSQSSNRNVAVVIQFKRNFLGEAIWLAPELYQATQLLDNCNPGLQFPIDQVDQISSVTTVMTEMSEMPTKSPSAQLISLMNILCILGEHARAARRLGGGTGASHLNRTSKDRINKIFRYIEAHYQEDLPQSDLASLLDMKPNAFSRFFRRATGNTVTAHINAVRITAACTLLIETEKPITEISLTCGFSNLSNFNRRFRELRNCTPREFRTRTRAMPG